MKNYKCKKWNLTFDNKLKECPYCHKKRFSFKPIIFVLVIALIGCGAFIGVKNRELIQKVIIFTKNEINNTNVTETAVPVMNEIETEITTEKATETEVTTKETEVTTSEPEETTSVTDKSKLNGVEVTIKEIKDGNSKVSYYSYEKNKNYAINLDFYNTTDKDIDIDLYLQVYVNDYLVGAEFNQSKNINCKLTSKMKMSYDFDITIDENIDINNVKIYYKDNTYRGDQDFKLLTEYTAVE